MMDQIKILHFAPSLDPGGMERQLSELIKGTIENHEFRHELVLLKPLIHYNDIKDLAVPITVIDRKSKKDFRIFIKFFKHCLKSKPNIIHSWNSMCSIYALPSVKLQKIKFVNGFLRDVPPNFNIKNKDWLRSKITFPFSDKIVSNTKSGLQAYKTPYWKSTYIYNGFDFNRINMLYNKNKIKRELNITTKYVVGMIAKFSDRKDHLTFFKSALKVINKRNDVSFVLIGKGKYFNYYKNVFNYKFKNKFFFLGEIKEVETIANALDIGVLTSNVLFHGEGISNSLMEFMALGKPIIATRCEGNHELISNSINGYLVNPFSPDELSEKIIFLLENVTIAKGMGHHAIETIKNLFGIEKMTNQYLALYKELL